MSFLGEETIRIEKEGEDTASLLPVSTQNAQEEVLLVQESKLGQEWIQMTEKSKWYLQNVN